MAPIAPSSYGSRGVSKGFGGVPEGSVWEDCGTLGKIRGITTPP